MKVPKDYVAAEPGLRKKTKVLKGAAGPRRARLLTEIKADKAKSASKIPFMSMQSSTGVAAEGQLALTAPAQAVPSPDKAVPSPDKIVIPEVVLPTSDEDFEVLVNCMCTGSSPDSGDRHPPPAHRDVHAVWSSLCSSPGRRRLNRRCLNHVLRKGPSSKILHLFAARLSLPRLLLANRR